MKSFNEKQLMELLRKNDVTIRSYQWFTLYGTSYKVVNKNGDIIGHTNIKFMIKHTKDLKVRKNAFGYTEYELNSSCNS